MLLWPEPWLIALLLLLPTVAADEEAGGWSDPRMTAFSIAESPPNSPNPTSAVLAKGEMYA